MKKQLSLFLISILFISTLKSQDIRGGYIQTKWKPGTSYTYSLSLTLYIDSAKNINRTKVPIFNGDGTSGTMTASSTYTSNGIVVYKYNKVHTYPGPGNFNVSFVDSFRVAGIKNITNSITQPFSIEAQLSINQFGGHNSSPSLSSEFINIGTSGNQFMINPGITDPDGDSLSYALGNCSNASNYYLPGTASVSPGGTFTFSKDSSDLHAFLYKISEWRKDLDGNYYLQGTSEIDFVTELKTSVGIKELSKLNEIKIYPNPVSTVLNIESEKQFSEIEITNVLGQTILKRSYSSKIDVSDLNSGVYYLKIIFEDNEVGVRKFVKN